MKAAYPSLSSQFSEQNSNSWPTRLQYDQTFVTCANVKQEFFDHA